MTYQIDVAHSGRAALEGFNGHLRHLWTRSLGGGISYPVIANGHIYVTVAAGTATVLYALDPVSGNTAWQAAIPGQNPVSSPAYDNGKVFVLNMSGLVLAFDAATGVQRWTSQLPREWLFPWPPVATDGLVFIGGQGTAGQLYAVSEKSGRIKWQTYVHDAGTPVAYGKFVAITSPCEQYYGFAAQTGEWLWTDESLYSGGGGATPVYYNNHVFVRDGCVGLFPTRMLNATTGTLNTTFQADLAPSFFTLSGTDYMVALQGGTLQATPVGSSNRQWTFGGDRQLSTAPLVVNDYVVEGSTSGKLYILRDADGAMISKYDTGSPIVGPKEFDQHQPLTGLGAADGVLIVPAGSELVAFAPK